MADGPVGFAPDQKQADNYNHRHGNSHHQQANQSSSVKGDQGVWFLQKGIITALGPNYRAITLGCHGDAACVAVSAEGQSWSTDPQQERAMSLYKCNTKYRR